MRGGEFLGADCLTENCCRQSVTLDTMGTFMNQSDLDTG